MPLRNCVLSPQKNNTKTERWKKEHTADTKQFYWNERRAERRAQRERERSTSESRNRNKPPNFFSRWLSRSLSLSFLPPLPPPTSKNHRFSSVCVFIRLEIGIVDGNPESQFSSGNQSPKKQHENMNPTKRKKTNLTQQQ